MLSNIHDRNWLQIVVHKVIVFTTFVFCFFQKDLCWKYNERSIIPSLLRILIMRKQFHWSCSNWDVEVDEYPRILCTSLKLQTRNRAYIYLIQFGNALGNLLSGLPITKWSLVVYLLAMNRFSIRIVLTYCHKTNSRKDVAKLFPVKYGLISNTHGQLYQMIKAKFINFSRMLRVMSHTNLDNFTISCGNI